MYTQVLKKVSILMFQSKVPMFQQHINVAENLEFNPKLLIFIKQHSFMQGKYIVRNLCQSINSEWCIYKRKQCGAMYIDMTKAFDTVCYFIFLKKKWL